jgi:hypothetical protein
MPATNIQRLGPVKVGPLWVAASLLGLACLGVWAGDPIQFSTPGKKVDAPQRDLLEEILNRPFDALKPGSSLGGVMPPMYTLPIPSSQGGGSRRERDSDDGKDWAFKSLENVTSTRAIEDLFKVQRYGADGRRMDKESLVQQFLAERTQNGARDGRRTSESLRIEDSMGLRTPGYSSGDALDRREPGLGGDRNVNRLTGVAEGEDRSRNGQPSRETLGGGLSLRDALGDLAPSREKAEKESLRANRLTDFQNMLNQGFQSGSTPRARDPFSVTDDATRRNVNPVAPRELMRTGGSTRDRLGADASPQDDFRRSKTPWETSMKPPGEASLYSPPNANSMLQQEAQRIKNQPPPVLTIPRRSF